MIFHSEADSQWEVQSSSLNYEEVFFVPNTMTAYAISNLGNLRKTSNAGASWQWLNIGTRDAILGVCFANENTGWVTAWDGKIFYTSNGGLTWTPQLSGVIHHLHAAYFINAQTGWIAGEHPSANNPVILKTTNAGVNWIQQTSNTTYNLTSIYFYNENTGWATGSLGTVVKTTNGGDNWFVAYAPVPSNYDFNKNIKFINDQTGWTMGNYVRKTTNGGQTWTKQEIDSSVSGLTGCEFINENTGWVAGRRGFSAGIVAKTTDGGLSWVKQDSVQASYLNSVTFTNTTTGIVVGNNGNILRTTNAGTNWIKINPNAGTFGNISHIEFINTATGWATGDDGMVLRTTNGGNNWNLNFVADRKSIESADFINESTGWITSTLGRIKKTTDAGSSWIEQADTNATGIRPKDIKFINENTGWVGGYDYSHTTSYLVKTTNGGINWVNVIPAVTTGIYSIFFLNENTGWMGGISGNVIKTVNGGQNWTVTNTNTGNGSWNSIYFIDANTGWMCGTFGYIVKTTDGGASWNLEPSGTGNHLNGIKFMNSLTGYAAGEMNAILKTTNGGEGWFSVAGVYNTDHHSIDIVNSSVYTAGQYVSILKSTGELTSGQPNSHLIPNDYELHQNYPNPFNPSTCISFSVPKSSIIKLIVYDITGREVSVLKNDFMQAGSHKIMFNASGLSSGVYFYKMTTNDFSEVKKMILVK